LRRELLASPSAERLIVLLVAERHLEQERLGVAQTAVL
jgi:hypothetical protein